MTHLRHDEAVAILVTWWREARRRYCPGHL